MRIFITKHFDQFRKKKDIEDSSLCEAITRAEFGLVDANLGGNIIKMRIAREGQGKSGGYRVVIVYLVGDRAFFVYGFPKSAQDNLSTKEIAGLKKFGKTLLELEDNDLDKFIKSGRFREVEYDA